MGKRPSHRSRAGIMLLGNSIVAAGLALYFLLIPGILVVRNLSDPALRTGDIPREAWRLHRHLAPRYERWARARVASGKAAEVHYLNVPGTEWPLFGSVFYLWATEHLQAAWEKDPALSPEEPAVYARGAVEACKELLLDPIHHTWVKTHWGDDYMHDQNVFFRSLLIAGLTSYQRLVPTGEVLPVLRDQADTLAAELDASPYGVLYDYPGECYPIDVFAAVAWIARSDAVTGADHSAFIARERRAFEGERLDKNGLIPWLVDPRDGQQFGASRGIVNTHVLTFAREIYPDLAKRWYDLTEEHFWQETWYGSGYREYYRNRPRSEWTYDVDAGPIIGGFSPAANAFGVAAARANGRLDHAYTLSAQVVAASWPLPDGRLLGPRILSDWVHAPYLGETALLWQLTETPDPDVETVSGGHLAGSIYIGYAFYFGLGALVLMAVAIRWRSWRRNRDVHVFRAVPVQLAIWTALLVAGLALFACNALALGVLALMPAQLLPVLRRE